MSVRNPRNRLVNFRLSDEEYERVRQSCATSGSRSISEFARTAVLQVVESQAADLQPVRVDELAEKVADLESRVQQFLRLLVAAGVSPSRSAMDCDPCAERAGLSRV